MESAMRIEIKESLDRYTQERIPAGGFLEAVLENNLMEAIGRADEENIRDIHEICSYVYNNMPYNCHGSKNIVNEWLKDGK